MFSGVRESVHSEQMDLHEGNCSGVLFYLSIL